MTATGTNGMSASFVYYRQPGERQDVGRSGRQIYESRLLGRTQGRLLLMFRARTAGFTLIELMIGLAIAGLLLVLAMPSYSVWIADGQIRNAAESIASGMRYAQSQASPATAPSRSSLPGHRRGLRASKSMRSMLQTGVFAEGSALATLDTDCPRRPPRSLSALSAGSSQTRTRARR